MKETSFIFQSDPGTFLMPKLDTDQGYRTIASGRSGYGHNKRVYEWLKASLREGMNGSHVFRNAGAA